MNPLLVVAFILIAALGFRIAQLQRRVSALESKVEEMFSTLH